MKACVAYSPGQPLRETFADWLARRTRLREFGIATPEMLVSGAAILIEEYVPFTLKEAVQNAPDQKPLMDNLGWTSGRLAVAGFMPLSIHDWRSRGTDAVLISDRILDPPTLAPDILAPDMGMNCYLRYCTNWNSGELRSTPLTLSACELPMRPHSSV
jgi:hypothetical protein